MMPFVKAFSSMDHVRAFLNSRNLVDELLSLEMEMGNFLEAAGIAKHKGDVLLEVDLLEKADFFENATELLLLHVIVNSLWASHGRGWPPKRFAEKEQLLAKAKQMAKKVSECFFCFVCLEADALSDVHKSLASLTYTLLEGRKCGNLLVELIAARSILDVHIQSHASGYNCELEPGSEDESCCLDMLARNQISSETLVYVWNKWKSIIVKVLSHLYHSEGQQKNDYAVVCEDLCAKYFGLRKDCDNERYVVLNMDSSWLSNAGRSSLQQDGNRCWLDAFQCHSCAQNFWMNELCSVGLSVLKKLESFVQISPKQASSYTLGRTILDIYEIAKFLKEPGFGMSKNTIKLNNFFVLCERRFFELVFLVWRDESTKSLLCILDSPAAHGLLADSLGAYTRPTNKKLTHGHLGRTTMLLLHAARLDNDLISKLMQYLDRDSEWADFFQSLKRFLDSGVGRSPLILNFKLALEFTYNANWRAETDYISPICYVDLMECLGFLASSHIVLNGSMFCTKNLLVKMLKCRTSKSYLNTCLVSSQDVDLDRMSFSAGRFICQSVRNLLTNKYMIQKWVQKTSTPTGSYIPVLLRLVVTLYLLTLTLSLGDCYEVTNFLLMYQVFEDLPSEFSQKIVHALQMRSRNVSNFTRLFADALAAIGNRMVVMGPPKGRPICRDLNAYKISRVDLNAYMISRVDLSDVENVMKLLCPEEQSIVKQESPSLEEIKSESNKFCNVTSGNFPVASVRDNKMESTSKMDLSDDNIPFWDKFEAFQVNKQGQKDARVIIRFLRSVLSWLEQRDPPKNIDAQLLEEVRRICNQFEERSARVEERSFLTAKDLYSMWKDGENKLQKIISFLRSEETSIKEVDRRNDAPAVVQFHMDRSDEWSECSDNEPDTRGSNAMEAAKEESAASCSSSKKKAQKQKNKKKSRKRNGKK